MHQLYSALLTEPVWQNRKQLPFSLVTAKSLSLTFDHHAIHRGHFRNVDFHTLEVGFSIDGTSARVLLHGWHGVSKLWPWFAMRIPEVCGKFFNQSGQKCQWCKEVLNQSKADCIQSKCVMFSPTVNLQWIQSTGLYKLFVCVCEPLRLPGKKKWVDGTFLSGLFKM